MTMTEAMTETETENLRAQRLIASGRAWTSPSHRLALGRFLSEKAGA